MADNNSPGDREVRDQDPVQEAAAGWVARLSSPDATDADRRAFEVWFAADPSHGDAYAAMSALWDKLSLVTDPRPRARMKKGPTGLAVFVLLAATLAYQLGLGDRMRVDLWSGVGDIRRATLPDGSRIDLNTDTAVTLRFTESERTVELLRGEAFFDVAPDPRRPFVVRSADLSARALGTRFVVRGDGTHEPVEVAEGRVEVAVAGRISKASAGETVWWDGSSLTIAKADVDRRTAWREGRLVFSGERLSAVLAELGRYRRGGIILLGGGIGDRHVTGVFNPRDTDEALDAIAATMGVRVTRMTPFLVLVSPTR